VEHQDALTLIQREYFDGSPKLRVFASPYPTNPYTWHAIVETPDHFQIATVDTNRGEVTTDGPQDVLYKPPTTLATLAAKRSWLGRVYLDWSMFPLVQQTEVDADGVATVTFQDLRFGYDTFLVRASDAKSAERLPLSGAARVDADRRVIEMRMDGTVQR
jgi:inner membrane protein